ncbi:hypothetical protein ACHQM5_018072 [Ranunculus cassubicifolius]
MYGFLPCAVNVWGHLYLIVVYQYLLFLADGYVASGSELMFRLLGPGIFGASAFQILGAVPQGMIVLASGIAGTPETAQAQVVSGVAMLAGSAAYLLLVLWGTCVMLGRVNLSGNSQSSTPLSFLDSGITTDVETTYTARIMILSIIPFIIAQLPHVFGHSSSNVATLVALIVSITILVVNCFYQVFQPWIQNRTHQFLVNSFVKHVLLEKLLTKDRRPNEPIIAELFHKIDVNNDNSVTPAEIKGLVFGIEFQEGDVKDDDFAELLLEEFNLTADGRINEKEFVRGISKWIFDTFELKERKVRHKCQFSADSAQETEEQQSLLTAQENTTAEVAENSFWAYLNSISLLLLGMIMLMILASPLTTSVVNFSNALDIPSSYISYIVVPFVSNYRRTLAAFNNVKQKTETSASLTLSTIYTAAFMNNIVSITALLGVVYGQGLVWDFSAEVLVVVILFLVVGIYRSFRTVFPLWTSLASYLLYPISLVLLYVLRYTYA